ncbi:MAG: Bug family tripartite tricarboxylate transporter substrate binding protein [Candidatus Binatia bacterium]
MNRKILLYMAITVGLVFVVVESEAGAAGFYEGKTLRLIVGTSPGGGYDTYARAIARHLDKYIPGNPAIIVQNMPGAGSLIAANYLYNVAKPNGLTVAMLISGLAMEQVMGVEGIKFDLQEFKWVGAPSVAMPVCAIMGFTGVKTLDGVLTSKKQLSFGAAGSSTREQPRILNEFLGANLKLVLGYRGTSSIRAAMERREVDGACWQWVSMRITAREMLDAKGDNKLIPFIIEGRSQDPEVKDLPQYSEFIKGKGNLAAFKAWLNQYLFFRPFALPPKTPKERVNILRTAFRRTLTDPDFQALAKKLRLDVKYVSGQEIEKYISEILSTPPAAKSKLRSIVGN